ncbi:MAG: hypothetical protein JW728_03335 [Candidatus Aureabacteria bacterium]|nr:hypothetical protein [Candidatus Auribacterota bacterium]
MKRIFLIVSVFVLAVSACVFAEETELFVADFEGWPNNLGGEIGVYGSLEPNWEEKDTVPYSWVYEPACAGYSVENIHDGKQSFRLVNAMGSKPSESWGSFSMNMGPTLDLTTMPITVDSKDVSAYKYFTFWVKGENGGEHIQILFRDANALNYMPQVKYSVPDATKEWKKVIVPLDEIKKKVDLKHLDNVGIAFGPDVGNTKGDTIYIDSFVFTNNE